MMLSAPLLALLAVGAPPPEADAAAKAAAVAPFLGDEVAAVVQCDLARLDVPNFLRSVLGPLADEADIRKATEAHNRWVDALRKAGAKDLFVLVDPADVPGVPVLVVPLGAGVDDRAVAKVLSEGVPRGPARWPKSETIRGALVAGTPAALARIRDDKPKPRPEVVGALAAAGDAPIRVAIVPSTTQRRAIEESMPNLPPELGGSPITTVSRGLRWASLAVAFEPKPTLRAVVQAHDAEAAKSLRSIAGDLFKLLAQKTADDPAAVELTRSVGQLTPETQGDRLILDVDLQKTAVLIAVPVSKAREAARRSQSVNNLKQIGLAMHNYHSVYNSFPPAYSVSQDGKPLLSWRVHILPFLEQKALYDEFKLDEPWDSPHNKPLISRIPSTYICPSASGTLATEGKTTYLTPRGPSTIFPGAKAVAIKEITDGTSNTILVLDANDDAAATWTRPDDWDVPAPFTTKGLFGHHPHGTSFGYADGSVRFIKDTITLMTLQALLTRDGGEVIGSDSY